MSIGVLAPLSREDFFDDFDDVPPSWSSASNALGSRPAATASWRARYGLRPAAISRLTSATVGVLLDAFAARALAAVALEWSKLALQPGVRSIEYVVQVVRTSTARR